MKSVGAPSFHSSMGCICAGGRAANSAVRNAASRAGSSDVPYSLNRGIPLRDINYYAARAYENIARRITGHQVPLMRI